jgi:hypothetical protein
MTSRALKDQASNSIKEPPNSSPNGFGNQQPPWVVVLPNMTTLPLLFANIPQQVTSNQLTSTSHINHM